MYNTTKSNIYSIIPNNMVDFVNYIVDILKNVKDLYNKDRNIDIFISLASLNISYCNIIYNKNVKWLSCVTNNTRISKVDNRDQVETIIGYDIHTHTFNVRILNGYKYSDYLEFNHSFNENEIRELFSIIYLNRSSIEVYDNDYIILLD